MFKQTGPIKTVVPGVGKVLDTMTNLHGSVYGVLEGNFGAQVYYFGLLRKVDYLAPQFKAALASGEMFPSLKIQTPSGHVVSFVPGWGGARVNEITKAGHRPSWFGGSYIAVGMEVITYEGEGYVAVDSVIVSPSYAWLSLNS
ncbi:MAG TPA: hypothetical protein VK335_07335 [Bryobacteraceae bacterium]|nr:hypothetical protein [Bryobacteraceae bacterium]